MNNLELSQQAARYDSHLCFIKYCWRSQIDKFKIGFHTERICSRIDKALEDYKKGKSTYLSIAVHPRSGKSEIVSRSLPPRFLGLHPDRTVISATYNQSLVKSFSKDAINIIKTDKYKELYPDIYLTRTAVTNWAVFSKRTQREGEVFACSLYAGLNGKGASLAILDDYCANREQAESEVQRNKAWDAFTNDFMSRLDPVHIVIILATPWHLDDIRGRIQKEMANDDNFPKFEFLTFPAKAEEYEGTGKYPSDYLFEERYSKKWYKNMYSVLGSYAASSLMGCNPTQRGGNLLNTKYIKYHDSLAEFPKRIRYARVWDLGHMIKKKGKKDPDPTGGTLLGFRKIGMNDELKIPIVELWIKHYTEFRANAPERDKKILQQIYIDGQLTDLVLEATTDSIDMVNQVKTKLWAVKKVNTLTVTQAKHVRIAPLESVFDVGNVHLLKADWNEKWKKGVESFDGSGSTHDEMIDNMATGYQWLVNKGKKIKGAYW